MYRFLECIIHGFSGVILGKYSLVMIVNILNHSNIKKIHFFCQLTPTSYLKCSF